MARSIIGIFIYFIIYESYIAMYLLAKYMVDFLHIWRNSSLTFIYMLCYNNTDSYSERARLPSKIHGPRV